MTTNSKALNGNRVQSAADLVAAISGYPSEWCFIPIRGDKAPCGRGWEQTRFKHENFQKALSDKHFSELLYQPRGTEGTENRKPVPLYWMKAIGVLCGTPSGGLLCFDHDGESADALVEELSGMPVEDALPPSPTVTSGKTGRYQILYYVPEMYWGVITSKRILTGAKVWNSFKNEEEGEQIEFRWDGLQSVILGVHPETGSYSWVDGRSPVDLPVAEAPMWMIEQMLEDVPSVEPSKPARKAEYSISDPVPLENCIAHKNRERLAGVDKGGRNNSGAALARDLIATERYLSEMGHRWTGSARQLFDEFCSRCTPPIPDKEADIIWKSAEGSNPTPACNKYTSDGVENCVKAWQKSKTQWVEPTGDGDRHSEPPKEIELDELEEESKRLAFDLQRYLKESCPRKRLILRQKICASYRINKQDFTEQIILLERDNDLHKKRKMSGLELFQQVSESIDFLIPRYLPRGEAIMVAAEAGCGKTNLVTDALYAVLAGDRFLGEEIGRPGRVLFISSDESLRTTQRRLYARGVAVLNNLEDLHIWEELDITRLEELEMELEDFRPDLVIVDSVTTICSNVGISEKDPEFARYLYKLKTLLNRYNAASIILHHANKDPLAKGLGKVSGSARIPAAFWGVFLLERVESNPENPMRWLRMVKGREVSEFKVKLEIHSRAEWLEKGVFSVQQDDTEHDAALNKQHHLMHFFKSQPGIAFEFEEISYAIPYPKATLYRLLDQLVDSKQLGQRKSSKNQKRWVWIYDTHPHPPSPQGENENENLEPSPSNGFRHSHSSENENETESQGMAIAKQYRADVLTSPTPKPVAEEPKITPQAQSENESENDGIKDSVKVSAPHSHSQSKARGGVGFSRKQLPGTPVQMAGTANGCFSVGDMVRTDAIAGNGSFQIEKLTSTHAQLSMGYIVEIHSLTPVEAKTA